MCTKLYQRIHKDLCHSIRSQVFNRYFTHSVDRKYTQKVNKLLMYAMKFMPNFFFFYFLHSIRPAILRQMAGRYVIYYVNRHIINNQKLEILQVSHYFSVHLLAVTREYYVA